MALLTPFIPRGSTDLQQNTELALYLLRYLEQKRDPRARIWPGERGVRTLQYACQALEALHELNLKGLTNHLTEPAVNWLLALPLDLPADDLRAFRLFPARFKTLARLGRFDAARLMGDFDVLSQLFDPATGWIHDAPVDLHPTLVTMLWADTLLHLEAGGPLPPTLLALREQALMAINASFDVWLNARQTGEPASVAPGAAGLRPGEFANPGDAGYAYDLLARAGQRPPTSPGVEAACQVFTALVRDRHAGDLRRPDLLHTALHLQARFPHVAETRAVSEALLRDLRQSYENDECQDENLTFHALVLRLLAAYHGEGLRMAILERLWRDSVTSAEAHEREEQAELETEFVNLVRQSIRVHLAPPQRITGTRARGEVYRLRFGLTTESTDEHGAPLSAPRDTLRLIVKKGAPDVLAHAIERYRNLPEPLQRLFARHADIPQDQAPGYLIMQDLADMQPLSEVLAELDRPVVLADERSGGVADAAASVCRVMQALHGFQRRSSLIGYQLDVVYLAPMTQALERLAQPSAFPELRHWLTDTLLINNRKYRRLDWYLLQLRRHEAVLNPASLGFVHGDCHSRNLMLSRDYALAKFVDIETLSSADDYIVDYGLLIEDIAVYQSLPYGSERGRVSWDDIELSQTGEAARENRIKYPAFPRSEAVVAFQAELLRGLRAYAESLGDASWQARLWLAIARGLLLLATRQLTSHTVEPQRRLHSPRYVNDVRLVQTTYAEAIRLLRELVEHLNSRKGQPLPDLPFPGEHRPPASESQAVPLASLLDTLLHALGDDVERRPVTERPDLTDFITRDRQHLLARIALQDEPPVMYLAARPEQLSDPHGLAAPIGLDDAAVVAPGLGSRVALGDGVPAEALVALVRQAQELAAHIA
jgi:hypothetical protein